MNEMQINVQKHFSLGVISFSAGWHEDVWNILAVESLSGDMYGFFGNRINITTYRINNFDDILRITEIIKASTFDLIGYSLDTGSYDLFFKFLKRLRIFNISPPMVCGGTLATYTNDFLIENEDFMYFHPVIVLGDGELVLRELIIAYINDKPVSQIINIMYYDNNVNSYIKTKRETTDINQLIYPPQQLVYNNRRYTVHILQASRNCIFSCSYCTQGPNKKWRPLPINRVKQNIVDLVSLGAREFEFVDDEFFGGISSYCINRAYEIVDIFREVKEKYQADIKFRIFTNPCIISSKNEFKELLKDLKTLGLSRVYLGIESGSEKQRKRYNRKDSLLDCKKAINILEELELIIDAGFIMFDPEVDVDELLENIKFINEINLLKYNSWPLRPIAVTAQTPLYFRMLNLGLLGERSKVNPASFSYNFKNATVQRIYSAVEDIANRTSKIFYILKYFYKEYCYNVTQKEKIKTVYNYLKKNAEINLQYIQSMITELEDGNSISESTEFVRNNLLKLIYEIRDNIHMFNDFEYSYEYLFDSINDSVKKLLYS